jgi:hypothetical protein
MVPSNTTGAARNDLNYLASCAGLGSATLSEASTDAMLKGDIRPALLLDQRVRTTHPCIAVADGRCGALQQENKLWKTINQS